MDNDEDRVTTPNFQPQGIRFDRTITLGNVLTLLAGVMAMGGAYVDYRVTLDKHENRIGNTEARIIELSARMSEEAKARGEMTHAIDRLTTIIEITEQRRKEP